MGKLEVRASIEVFVNENGTISIKQDEVFGQDPDLVVVHPSDVEWLVRELRTAKRQATTKVE